MISKASSSILKHPQASSSILKHPQASLFERPYERLNLSIGVLFLLISLGVIFVFGSAEVAGRREMILVADFFFLNVVHVGFSFVVFFQFPESRSWLWELSPKRRYLILGGIPAVFMSSFVLNLFLFKLIASPLFFVFCIQVSLYAIRNFHTIRQFKGLSLLYNRSVVTSVKHKRIEKIERFFFDFFLLCIFLVITTRVVFNYYGLFPVDGIIRSRFLPMMVLLALFGIFASVALQIKEVGIQKGIYCLRILLVPLGSINGFILYLHEICHGMEYFFITQKMYKNSYVKKNWRFMATAFFLILMVASIPVAHFFITAPKLEFFAPNSLGIKLFHTFTLPFTIVHFYLDSVMYKMSDPVVRKHLGKLLISA